MVAGRIESTIVYNERTIPLFLAILLLYFVLHLSVMFIVMDSVFYKHQNILTRFRHHTRRGQSPLTLKVIGEIVRITQNEKALDSTRDV